MSKDPGYSDSKKDTLESRNRFLQERNETLINKIEYLNQVNDGLHLLLKEQENAYETLNAHDEMLIATVDKLKEENDKLKSIIKDLVNNGMDADIATRIEEIGEE